MDECRERYERRVRELVAFGHRGSATENERRAAEYLGEELRGLGLAPTIEPFRGSGSLGMRLLLPIAVAAAGLALMWWLPVVTAALGVAALFSMVVEQMSRGLVLGRLLPRPMSQNVTARLRPAAGDVSRRLIVCGHYDTQRTGMLFHEQVWRRLTPFFLRLPPAFQVPMVPVCLAMAGQVVLGFGVVGGLDSKVALIAGGVLAAIYVGFAAPFAEWSVRRHVPGAADNASGAAAVLAIAEQWDPAACPGTELVLLLPGCEESGLLGAGAWADRHVAELREIPTVFLNLDGLGFGPPRVVEVEVPLAGWPARYPRGMVERCSEVAVEGNAAGVRPRMVPVLTDGTALLARGLSGVTVVGMQPDGRLPHWHQMTDDVAHLDFDAAWEGVVFAGRVARVLGRG